MHAQNWTWAETAGGILPDEAGGCAMDSAGNMFMSGFFFSNSINFNNGNSINNAGICDGFIVKYNTSGNCIWSSRIKGSGEDKATRCAVDRWGNVFATGYFDSPSIQFGGNNNNSVNNFDNSGNTFDAFIVKYSSAGTPMWFHAIGKTNDDGGNAVTADTHGNVYITGWFRASSIPVGNITLYNEDPSGGTADMFIIKYDPNGNVLWAKSVGSNDDDKGNSCIVDPSGNVIVTGYFKGNSLNVEGTYYQHNGGSKDVFVVKYNSAGVCMGAKIIGGSGSEEGFACSADGSGNVFVTGNFSSITITIDLVTLTNTGSSSGAFLLKLDSTLTAVWARTASSNSNDESRGCSSDIYGNTVITGVFTGSSITFGNTVLNNNGEEEIFLAKYDRDGNLFWAKKIGKSKADGTNDCFLHNSGKILVVGYYNSSSLTLGNIDLDNSYQGIATSDVFIATTCNAGIFTDTQTACNSFTWIDGNTYTSNNNTASVNFPGASSNACDSMVVLDLILNTANASVTDNSPTLTADETNAIYRWLDCNNNYAFMLGQTLQTFTATANGSYALEITQNMGCVDTSNCYNIIVTDISTEDSINWIKVYPNPTDSHIQLELGVDFKKVTIEIKNIMGQTVYSRNYTNLKNTLLELPEEKGIYFIELTKEENWFASIKLIKKQ